MVEVALSIKSITKKFDDKKVLDDLSFDVNKGEILGLIGVSGGGKTTLLKTLIGFHIPDSGDILYQKDENLVSVYKDITNVKKSIGFGPQDPSFYPELSVIENLRYFGTMFDLPSKTIEDNSKKLLEWVYLDTHSQTLAKNLSGGMIKRLGLLIASIHKPDVLILDEPTADLDPESHLAVQEFIQKINEKGVTVIIASHHLEDIDKLCDRVVFLKKGRLDFIGSPAELKSRVNQSKEIHVTTLSQNYSKILNVISRKNELYSSIEEKENKLIFYTNSPEQLLPYIMHIITALNEQLTDINIYKPSLSSVFEKRGSAKHEEDLQINSK